ncbi:protein-L-isoaspartate O-methyltransferase family protein [Streptomyces decoyicus]
MNAVAVAADAVPERHYTHHTGRGATPHRSNPVVIHRELSSLDLQQRMRVAEYGTGSGYSGALIAELVGPEGEVISLDVDGFLTRWANAIHHERGLQNIRCHTADGTNGFPERAPYHRVVSWCTPPLLPKTWVDYLVDGGLIVAPLPIANVPNTTVVTTIRVTDGEPRVEAITGGCYIEATSSPKTSLDVPTRWVDWEYRLPGASWISITWRADDDDHHTGARSALDLLLKEGHTEPYGAGELDWLSWRTFAAARGDQGLTMAGLRPDLWAIGHTTPDTAAVIQQDGTIIADTPNSPSLAVLREWLTAWEKAQRPSPEAYTPRLVGNREDGWELRLSL